MATRKSPAAAAEAEPLPDPETIPEPAQPADDSPVDEATGEIIEDADVVDDTEPETEPDDTIVATVDDTDPVVGHGTTLTLLPTSSDPREWDAEQKALLDAAGLVVRKGGQVITAPRPIIAAFLTQCHRTQLDPIARQIYCIERGGKWTIQTSIDGFRVIAQRSGEYAGQSKPEWTADGKVWVEVWLSDEPPAAARIGVFRKGFVEPVYGIATYKGYCPRDKNGNLSPVNQWKTNPSNQLLKCAESLALRKAFPQDLSGLYTADEMDQGVRVEPEPRQVRTPAPQRSLPAADQAPGETTVVSENKGDLPPEIWEAWLEAINGAETLIQLTRVRTDAGKQGLLTQPIPGDEAGRKISDYFEHRRAQLTSQGTTAASARLQQGLHQDTTEKETSNAHA